jgi:hypothetical protein
MIIGDLIWEAVFSASPTFFKPALYSSTELKVYGRGRFCRLGLPTRNDLPITEWRFPCVAVPIQQGIEPPQHQQLQHTTRKQLLVSTSHLWEQTRVHDQSMSVPALHRGRKKGGECCIPIISSPHNKDVLDPCGYGRTSSMLFSFVPC